MDKQQSQEIIAKKILEIVPLLRSSINAHIHHEIDRSRWVTPGQMRMLYLIDQGITGVQELAARQRVSAPTVSRQVDCLVEKGLVQRERLQTDRRMVVLTLTLQGMQIFRSVMGSAQTWVAAQLSGLEPAELANLLGALDALRESFKPETDGG